MFSTVGLACLLFLAGPEIQVDRAARRAADDLAGRFAISFALAFGSRFALGRSGLIETPLLVAIVFVATSLSIIIVPLKERTRPTPIGASR